MTTFTIVEGYNDLEKYEENFIEVYNDKSIPACEIPDLLNISKNEYQRLRRNLHDAGKIKLRRASPNKNRKKLKKNKCYSITRSNGYTYYQIVKNREYYCSVKTEAQAKKMVELMEKVDWDKSKMAEIKAYVKENY